MQNNLVIAYLRLRAKDGGDKRLINGGEERLRFAIKIKKEENRERGGKQTLNRKRGCHSGGVVKTDHTD